MVLAGQRLGLGVGVCTMTATWVDGGYVNGTAEQAYGAGLLFVQAPWGYALSLIVGGLWFAPIMRRHGFTTLLDPFEQRFGKKSAALLYLPALTGEVFWTAAILTALGTTFGLILDLDVSWSIVLSAAVVLFYTFTGGLWAVAITDVAQLFVLIIGLAVVVPFVAHAVGGFSHGMAGVSGGGREQGDAGQLVDVDRHGAAAGLRRHSVARVLPARPRRARRRRRRGGCRCSRACSAWWPRCRRRSSACSPAAPTGTLAGSPGRRRRWCCPTCCAT